MDEHWAKHYPEEEHYKEIMALYDCSKRSYSQEQMWVDKVFERAGVHVLTEERYIDWVYNAPKDSRPWLIWIGKSQYGHNRFSEQSGAQVELISAMCIAEVYGDRMNVGFIDNQKQEALGRTFATDKQRLGEQLPRVMLVKDGQLHYTMQKSHNAEQWFKIAHWSVEELINEDTKTPILTWSEPVPYPYNEITIYLDYAAAWIGNFKAFHAMV